MDEPEMQIGTRFTVNRGRYDRRVWEFVKITHEELPSGNTLTTFDCRAEGSDDWWFMATNPAQKLKDGEIRLIANPADNIAKVEAALEFLPKDAPIPMDLGTSGMLFKEAA